MHINFTKYTKAFSLLAIFVFMAVFIATVDAGVVDELRSKISDRNAEIMELEKQVAEYQDLLEDVGREKSSLQKEVRTLDLTRKKISTDIKVTNNKIKSTSLNIAKLEFEIGDKEKNIDAKVEALKIVIRRINEINDNSLVELVLSSSTLSDVWNEIETFQQFNKSISEDVQKLRLLKVSLEDNKTYIEEEQGNLLALKARLSDQKAIVEDNRTRQSRLLSKTKNKESNYQKQLKERQQRIEDFTREMLDLEAQLQIAIDPNSLPSAGKGILRWPLDKIRITQYFGNTKFAQSGAYNGKGHNGVDFGVPTGTDVMAVLPGTVVETGNTDLINGCYSYGKWALVRHNNGLSTLYAHMSLVKAKAGDNVSTGDVIGYSGNTGYSTGPHLHLTLYATQGVEVVRLGDVKKITNCGDARIPIAPFNAYLNPLDYL